MNKEVYYICKVNGENRTVAKKVGVIWYRWIENKWEEEPSLICIENDITDFEEVSKEEAEETIKWQQEHWKDYIEKISRND